MEATKINQPPLMCLKGNDLVLEREFYGMSQAELAKRMRELGAVNARQQQISAWEEMEEFCVDEYTFNIMILSFSVKD